MYHTCMHACACHTVSQRNLSGIAIVQELEYMNEYSSSSLMYTLCQTRIEFFEVESSNIFDHDMRPVLARSPPCTTWQCNTMYTT